MPHECLHLLKVYKYKDLLGADIYYLLRSQDFSIISLVNFWYNQSFWPTPPPPKILANKCHCPKQAWFAVCGNNQGRQAAIQIYKKENTHHIMSARRKVKKKNFCFSGQLCEIQKLKLIRKLIAFDKS